MIYPKPLLGFFAGLAILYSNTSFAADALEFSTEQEATFSTPGAVTNAWSDYDNDGDLDRLVLFAKGDIRLYQNNNNIFHNVGPSLGLPEKGAYAIAAAWGDYDNDGDVDLYIGYRALTGDLSNSLYRNDLSDKRFVNVTSDLGLEIKNPTTRQVSWVDHDNDGDLDLFVAQRMGFNRFYRNDGGKFADISWEIGLADPRRTVGAVWFDMDQDGDLDVFMANQSGDQDALYRNDGDKFFDVARDMNIHLPNRPVHEGSVAASVADYDNDGDLDLFVGTYGVNRLYQNNGTGHFLDVAPKLGITQDNRIVGSAWGDYDHDGRIDLYLTGSVVKPLHSGDYLFRNTPEGFVNVLPAALAKIDGDHGVQWADFDQDGDLDLALTSNHPQGNHFLFRNHLAEKNHSLQVWVLDKQGHVTKVGAEVRFFDTVSRKLLGTRLVDTGGGYNAQSVRPVHFGLSESVVLDIEVTFLTALGRQTMTTKNINPKHYIGKALVIREQ